jgi:Uma2 family endonuclease
MSTILEPNTLAPPQTLAELVKQLGDIPLERIRMEPPPGTATEEDAVKTRLCELVDGCLVDKDIRIESHECDGPPQTVAQLVHRLGDIPLERIRMQPAPGTATEADVIQTKLCELIDGVLVEKPMAFIESCMAAVLIGWMRNYVTQHRNGIIAAPDAKMRILSHQVREPDVSFIRAKQMPDGKVPKNPVAALIPDLAVEILSPGNTKAEMDRKRKEYFQSGTSLVWIVDPPKVTVRVYTSPTNYTDFGIDDTLDGGDVMPDFRVSIREWFDEAENVVPPQQ